MSDWYECIEPEIREIVRELRNSGVNTTCSCGHGMWIEGDSKDLNEDEQCISNIMLDRGLEFELVFVRSIMNGANYRCFHLKINPKVEDFQCMSNNLEKTVANLSRRPN